MKKIAITILCLIFTIALSENIRADFQEESLFFHSFSQFIVSNFWFQINSNNNGNTFDAVFDKRGDNGYSAGISLTHNSIHYQCSSAGYVHDEIDILFGDNTIQFSGPIFCISQDNQKFKEGTIRGGIKVTSSCHKSQFGSHCENFIIDDISLDLSEVSIILYSENTVNQSDIEQRLSTLEAWKITIDSWKNSAISIMNNHSQQLFALQTWKQTIDDWKDALTNTISTITNNVSNLFSTTNDHEERIETLENESPGGNNTIPNFFKFLGSSDRKNIVCGVAKENHLDYLIMEDLGYECDVTYRQTPNGERATCRCHKL